MDFGKMHIQGSDNDMLTVKANNINTNINSSRESDISLKSQAADNRKRGTVNVLNNHRCKKAW